MGRAAGQARRPGVPQPLRVRPGGWQIHRVTTLEPLLVVLGVSGLAALAAALGPLPLAFGRQPGRSLIGWANALAGGLMIGVAYALLTEGLGDTLVAGGFGAVLGILFVRTTHALVGTGELDVDGPGSSLPGGGYTAIVVDSLHAADEGVAIGVAMAVAVPLGVAMATTLAVHNIPEAMLLSTVLTRRGLSVPRATGVAVAHDRRRSATGGRGSTSPSSPSRAT